MKTFASLLTLLLLAVVTPRSQAQVTLAEEDFEGADFSGYSTLSGAFAVNGADYLARGTNGAPFVFDQPVTGYSGSNFIGLEDIDGAGLIDPHWLELDAIDVTGYENLSVSMLVAAPNSYALRYEIDDFLVVEYSLDGGAYTVIGRFIGVDTAGALMHDTNLDGVGDVAIGAAMQRYTYSLGGAKGSSLKVRVRFSSAGPQEEMAFDDIIVTGTLQASTCGNGVTEGAEVCDDGYTDACGTCNATCTGAGAGSSCGDGALCAETEACDDGYNDACGTCNATCTGAGAGSSCGDGALCAETEACDDGYTDAWGT
ncbi:MAG: hypothetical protein OEZ06_29425, partial [Myxococcales bacterium]|nr:hypothetical protein [Myxococcales bacterium]